MTSEFINRLTIKNPRKRKLVPWLALFLSLFGTIYAWQASSSFLEKQVGERFAARADQVTDQIVKRLQANRTILRGGSALFAANGEVSRQEWRSYVEHLRVRETHPGIQGFGFARVVRPDELQRHITAVRSEGFPEYTVRPEGVRDLYTSIIYLEPFDERNRRAFGFDMFSEPVRRAAMEAARDSGTTVISGKVKLMQETEQDVQAGFLMYVPVYAKGLPVTTVAGRRAALRGFVYSPLRIKDLLQGAVGSQLTDISVKIYDGTEASEQTLMLDSGGAGQKGSLARQSLVSDKRVVEIYGHKWTLHYSSLPLFEDYFEHDRARGILAAGLLISLLLFLFVWSLEATRDRALAIASDMTAALRKSEEELQEAQRVTIGLNEVLEQRVEERTRELEDANRELRLLNDELILRRREAEDARCQADNANRTKSEFLANMSHELRTPLNSVIGFAEVLQDQLCGALNEKQSEYAGNIAVSGRHLLALINDILDLSKVESGNMQLEPELCSLRDLLDLSLTMLKERAFKNGVSLSLDIDPAADVKIIADQRKLKQIMFNLMSNAVKFTPDGGRVKVTARRVGNVGAKQEPHLLRPSYDQDENRAKHNETVLSLLESDSDFIEITVTDTGIGIKPEDFSKLFKSFTQLESGYAREFEGTGLGLVLTKKLVELHGGTIRVESRYGEGSSFIFTMPLTQAAAGETPAAG